MSKTLPQPSGVQIVASSQATPTSQGAGVGLRARLRIVDLTAEEESP